MEDVFKLWLSARTDISNKKKQVQEAQAKVISFDKNMMGQISSDHYMKYKEAANEFKKEEAELISLEDKLKKYEEEIIGIFNERPDIEIRVSNETERDTIISLEHGKITHRTLL